MVGTYLLHPPKKLFSSCVVPLGFCEQLAQALDRKWNSKIQEGNDRMNMQGMESVI